MKSEMIEKIREHYEHANMSEHDEIIAEAREEYTVHNCGQCEFRKSCNLGINCFDSDKCREIRQSIMLGFGIEDGYFTKLLDRLEAAHKREVETSRATSEKSSQVGNAAKMREALKAVEDLLKTLSKSHATTLPKDIASILGEMAFRVNAALAEPLRNCDVGTAEEQEERYIKLKREHVDKLARCPAVGPSFFPDSLYWAQMPYEEAK